MPACATCPDIWTSSHFCGAASFNSTCGTVTSNNSKFLRPAEKNMYSGDSLLPSPRKVLDCNFRQGTEQRPLTSMATHISLSYPHVKTAWCPRRSHSTPSQISSSLHEDSKAGTRYDPHIMRPNMGSRPGSGARSQCSYILCKPIGNRASRKHVTVSLSRNILGFYTKKPCALGYRQLALRQLAGRRIPHYRANSSHPHSRTTVPRASLGGDTPGGSRGGPPDGGDSTVQNMLIEVLRIQMGKARVTQFLDEKSEHLREIAEASNAELDRIAKRAMDRVDGIGSKVLRDLDAGALAVERDLEIARIDLEAQERDFEEFEARMYSGRNEGLFFQNLYPRVTINKGAVMYPRQLPRVVKIAVKVEVVSEEERDFETYRFFLYGGITAVLLSFLWSASTSALAGSFMRLPKLGAYGVIMTLLLLQLKYEKLLMGGKEGETVGEEEKMDPRK